MDIIKDNGVKFRYNIWPKGCEGYYVDHYSNSYNHSINWLSKDLYYNDIIKIKYFLMKEIFKKIGLEEDLKYDIFLNSVLCFERLIKI